MKGVGKALGILGAGIGVLVGAALAPLFAAAGAGPESCSGEAQAAPTPVMLTALLPSEIDGFSGAQLRNAATIVSVAAARGLDGRAAQIAMMVAIQESGLLNLANAGQYVRPINSRVMSADAWSTAATNVALSTTLPNDGVVPGDWDSLGLFQQRLSAHWGGPGPVAQQVANLLDPIFTTGRFFDALLAVPDWRTLTPATAAQAVQHSAFPSRYDAHWAEAGDLVEILTGTVVQPTGATGCGVALSGDPISVDGWTRPIVGYTALSSPYGMRMHPTLHVMRMHAGQDLAAPAGTPIYAAAAGTVVQVVRTPNDDSGLNYVVVDHGGGVSTAYLHSEDDGILVEVGQHVSAGQQIATVGSSGQSTGPHLHFEYRVNGLAIEPLGALRSHGVSIP